MTYSVNAKHMFEHAAAAVDARVCDRGGLGQPGRAGRVDEEEWRRHRHPLAPRGWDRVTTIHGLLSLHRHAVVHSSTKDGRMNAHEYIRKTEVRREKEEKTKGCENECQRKMSHDRAMANSMSQHGARRRQYSHA